VLCNPIFATQFKLIMEQHNEYIQERNEKDFGYNWVTSSRFLFYMQVFCLLAFVLGGCYRLYNTRYKGKPDIEIQSSTKYKPEYK